MKRGRAAALALVLVHVACRAHAPGLRLPDGALVLARGSLAYAVGFADDDRLVSIELEERFALVVRDLAGRVLGRHDLGPAERDLTALALVDDEAWLGGADQQVRAIGLDDGRVRATWPMGDTVTALTANRELVVIGLATGAVCLRRRDDGALLQCVQLGDRPVTALAITAGGDLTVIAGPVRSGLTLPALARTVAPRTDPGAFTPDGRDLRRGGAVVLRLGGGIRAVVVDDDGRTAVAAWVTTLDDPSVVLLPAPR